VHSAKKLKPEKASPQKIRKAVEGLKIIFILKCIYCIKKIYKKAQSDNKITLIAKSACSAARKKFKWLVRVEIHYFEFIQ
jgi:hypothetical protein